MHGRIRRNLTFANVCSFVAMSVALGTGGAYAANTIGSADIIDGEVKAADIGIGQVLGSRIADGTIKTADIADNRVGTADVTNGSLRDADLLDDGVTGAKVLESSLGKVPSAADADTVNGRRAGLTNAAVTINFTTCEEVDDTVFTVTRVTDTTCRATFPAGTVQDFGLPFVEGGVLAGYQINGGGGGYVDVGPGPLQPFAFVQILTSGPAPVPAGRDTQPEEGDRRSR